MQPHMTEVNGNPSGAERFIVVPTSFLCVLYAVHQIYVARFQYVALTQAIQKSYFTLKYTLQWFV